MQAFAGASLSGLLAYIAAQYSLSAQGDNLSKQPKQQTSSQSNFFKVSTITPGFRLISYTHFNILYSTYHKAPLAVHELITKQLAQGDAPRARFFYPEDQISQKHFQVDNAYFTDTQAFARFNLNRGHMAAAGNYSGVQSQKFHTFTFANVIPQNGHNNGGIWNTFERYTRSLALSDKCESVQIISGPIYPQNSPYSKDSQKKDVPVFRSVLKVLKQDGAPIPEKLYKIIKCNSKTGPYLSTYEFLNKETQDNSKALSTFEVPLENVQQQTGLKFNISGKPLRQIDSEGLSKTKKELDYPFFFGLMLKSEKIGEMNENWRRAKGQKIQIQLNDLSPRIRQLTAKQMAEISTEDISSCQKLKKMFELSKKLYYLKNLEQTADLRNQKMEQNYVQCKSSGGEEFEQLIKDFKFDIKRLEQVIHSKG